jgi:beta-lactamase regulating signal transducer with metallopeptidase domain
MTGLLDGLWRASWQGSVLIALVLLVQGALGPRLAPLWRYALWMIVFARLALPVTPPSPASVFNLAPGEGEPPAARWVESVVYGPVPAGEGRVPDIVAPRRPAASPAAAPRGEPWRVIGLVWLAGFATYITILAVVNFRVGRRLRGLPATQNPALLDELITCRRQIGLRRRVRIVETDAIASPALWGVFRPTILLPMWICSDVAKSRNSDVSETSPDRHIATSPLRHILLHELAHIKRWDVAVNWLVLLVQAVHWFNPVVWLAAHRLRGDRELACDALVLSRAGGENPRTYGQTILRIIESAVRGPRGLAAVSMAESLGQLQRRLHMITHYQRPTWTSTLIGATLLALLGCAGLTDKKPQQSDAAAIETRVVTYDIADLIQVPPDHGWRQFPHGEPSVPKSPLDEKARKQIGDDRGGFADASGEAMTRQIIQSIQEMVDPESWSESGSGQITSREGTLIVRTTLANHDQILSLLSQLREQRALMLTYESRFLLAPEGVLHAIDLDLNLPSEDQSTVRGAYLNDMQVDRLVSSRDVARIAAPRTTTFNGQKAYVTIRNTTAYIAGYKPVADPNGPVRQIRFEPEIKTISDGILVDIRGTISADHRVVDVAVEPALSRLHKIAEMPFPGAPTDQPLTVEVPEVEVLKTRVTTSIPDRATLLLVLGKVQQGAQKNAGVPVFAKIPFINRLTANRGGVTEERVVLFLIKPTILVRAEKEEELFPDVRPDPEPQSPQEGEARVQELLRRAADLRRKLRYEESLDTLNEALRLDPDNIVSRAMKEMLEDSLFWQRQRAAGGPRRQGFRTTRPAPQADP